MTKDIAKSIKAKLLNLAKQERLDYQLLIIRYLYERLLYRLSISDYRERFYLKGGTLLYAFEKEYPRPTLDIDFLGVKIKNDVAHIKEIFIEICGLACEEDGVNFDINSIATEEITEQKDYTGIRLSLVAHLDTIRQVMKMDIGFGDVVTPRPLVISYPALMEELPTASILAYSLESVVAEKFQAMIELSEVNSRYKDFYDVYKILKNQELDNDILSAAIHATFQNRETHYFKGHPLFTKEFVTNEERNKHWSLFLKKIRQDDGLSFESVMTVIVSRLEPIYETLIY
ncbi:nucleotidyl transferase AbiEii/AbiGii toxin family protein [Proteiniphilum sp.]|uniref:nucleotidyl transferase AbiEii/AbiGii toxin family protein n=1 Tax=Proteiniphilum sp. TaxID=1926877 RepID=UPI00333377AA